MRITLKRKGNRVVFSLAFFILGFIFAFSYHLTKSDQQGPNISNTQWERTFDLRNELIEQEETNRSLQQELFEKQEKVTEIEQGLATEEQVFFNMAEDAEKYRMFLGKVKVKGQGVEITLADGEYNPLDESININNYIVHEDHLFKVINELKISGAAAIAINGQRINHQSYILCDGPVITVDGIQHPAPFIISAIGDSDVLYSALNLAGGVKDQLVNENILFSIEKKTELVFDPIIGG